MKLTITKKPYRGNPVGSEIDVPERQARLLMKLGRAAYMTRHMEAAPVRPVFVASPPPAPQPQSAEPGARTIKVDGADVALDGMEAAELHELAKQLGVKVHHASGAEKVRLALIDAQRSE